MISSVRSGDHPGRGGGVSSDDESMCGDGGGVLENQRTCEFHEAARPWKREGGEMLWRRSDLSW